jgi:hypothetical protein
MIFLHELLCIALFYSVFCRAVRMDKTTRADVRLALQAMGSVAALGIAVPLQWPTWQPDWFTLALLASITAVQLITAYHWRDGTPGKFSKPTNNNRRSRERRGSIP